jgi:septal ring factor EnvC (AmiA/AmiB activator)
MDDITELEQRIAAAFDRIDQGLDALARAQATAAQDVAEETELAPSQPPQGGISADAAEAAPALTALLRALEQAKASNTDWAERYSALQEQMSAQTLAMASEIARLTQELADTQMAQTADVAAPSLNDEIDDLTARLAAQEAELETLRNVRALDAEELGDIIAALAPLVEEASHV